MAGKRLRPGGSARSAENHERIGRAIAEAATALDRIVPGVRMSRDSHYQIANRVAYSWKLASMGVPVLLVFLGFTEDNGIADVGPPLAVGLDLAFCVNPRTPLPRSPGGAAVRMEGAITPPDDLLLPPDDLPVVRFHGRARKRSCESLSYYLLDRWQAQMQFGLVLVLHFAGGGILYWSSGSSGA
ncbi:MAG: hypothetical protein WBD63_03145 [Phycisphaerae bacterium]|nr:hypothetical protein [Phycisphaerae bacterium]